MYRNRASIYILPSPSQNFPSIIFSLEYYLSLLGLFIFFLVTHSGSLLIICPISLSAYINFLHPQHPTAKSSAGTTPTAGVSTSWFFFNSSHQLQGMIAWMKTTSWSSCAARDTVTFSKPWNWPVSITYPPTSLFSWPINPCLLTHLLCRGRSRLLTHHLCCSFLNLFHSTTEISAPLIQ